MNSKTFLRKLINNPEMIVELEFSEISRILKEAVSVLEKEDLLLEFSYEEQENITYVIGDIHGNLETLKSFLDVVEIKKPKLVIFLGDIVDRGQNQLECLIIILALKILEPQRYFILRGNHESIEMNQAYGFLYVILQKFKKMKRFNEFISLYDYLPICAILNKRILCLHGGIPKDIEILTKIKGKKLDDVDDALGQTLFQVLWNDPHPKINGFSKSIRGSGIKYFGEDVFDKFMNHNKLDYLIRSHEVFPKGFRWFFNKKLITVFSSSNYRGPSKPNAAAYVKIKKGNIILKIIKSCLD